MKNKEIIFTEILDSYEEQQQALADDRNWAEYTVTKDRITQLFKDHYNENFSDDFKTKYQDHITLVMMNRVLEQMEGK